MPHADVRTRTHFALLAGSLLLGAVTHAAITETVRFYPDDPIERMPPPLPVKHALKRSINGTYDFLLNSIKPPRETSAGKPCPAEAVNTLGDVPDSDWYTNRHYRRRMSIEELRKGPTRGHEPVMPLEVTAAKTEGVTPGFNIRDAAGRKYLIKFDPVSNPEMASAADVIGSKFFYAFGYNVPENYIVNFRRDQLKVAPEAKITDVDGARRPMEQHDLDLVLKLVAPNRDGSYRGMASFIIPGDVIGPFRYYGTRTDDPNDVVPHENRRDLRGLYVFAAWLQHTDAKGGNSLDSIVEENGIPRIKHYLIDFGASLGSDSDAAKNPKLGQEYFIDWKPGLVQALTLGLYAPPWQRRQFGAPSPAAGNFSATLFDPDHWKTNYPNAAFVNRLPDDEFWAAKQVVSFRPDEIRAMVDAGQFSSGETAAYITRVLIERQHKIGSTLLGKVLPLERFAVRDGRLAFEDVAAVYGYAPPRNYSVQWFRFDNKTGVKTPLPGETSFQIPSRNSEYYAADISAGDTRKAVTVYLRGDKVVGIDRRW